MRMKLFKLPFKWTIILFLLLNSCATNMSQQFARIQVGMEKDQVLALMDSPQRTQRWKGQDHWTYIFYDKDIRQEKEVHFDLGKAVYVGDHQEPAISAENKDQKNESSNSELEALYKSQLEESRKAYPQFEESAKGSSADSIRYVPQYQPIE